MRFINLLLSLAVLAGVAACNSNPTQKSCDEVRRYQLAEEGQRLTTPDDLDELEPLREIPLPQASPRPPRPEGSPCIDLPPSILGGQT